MKKITMQIEGDGATDRYGLRIRQSPVSFVIQDIPRAEMEYHLKDLLEQFQSLTACFDEMSISPNELRRPT